MILIKKEKVFHALYFILTLVLGIAIGNRIGWRVFAQSEPYYLITAILIMIISLLKDRWFETTAIRALERMKETTAHSSNELEKWIKTNLTPYLMSLDDPDKVLIQASNIINAAVKEPVESQQEIVFVGSGDLLRDPPHDLDSSTPISDYQTAMSQVRSNKIKVIRYISLLEVGDFCLRGQNTQADYLKWLTKQISQLEGNRNYFLYHCPRAPIWGSSRSSIITERSILDVVGNGQTGILIRGEQIARDIKESSRKLFLNAAVQPQIYGSESLKLYQLGLRNALARTKASPTTLPASGDKVPAVTTLQAENPEGSSLKPAGEPVHSSVLSAENEGDRSAEA